MPYHYRYDYDYTVELPEGYEAQLPEKLVVDTPWFEAYINYSVENGVLHCRARMATGLYGRVEKGTLFAPHLFCGFAIKLTVNPRKGSKHHKYECYSCAYKTSIHKYY